MNQFEDYYNEGTQDPDKDIESGQWEDLCLNCGGPIFNGKCPKCDQ